MPSYKKHALFSIIIAIPFIQDFFYLSLALIGAAIIDMDHHVKKKNLILMAVLGVSISLILFILNLPFLIGISLMVMALIFYISKHRGFTHSIFGIILLSILLTFFILGFYNLFYGINIDNKIQLIAISLILGIITLNKKMILPFIIVVPLGIILTPNLNLSLFYTFLALFLGCLSHIILDLFTPSGIKLLNPLSPKKFKKGAGIFLFLLWCFSVFIFVFKGSIF
ncbi:MAG: metal-dependent hydrolase [Methanobacterium sp.]|uniref:metal-dependent hydrolase n=1 Tax=Methanobacterium sp. TaxID=2164 RepID=UPI003D652A40|nr:metal-dependent hydrolase [Methanobacterium sp.]